MTSSRRTRRIRWVRAQKDGPFFLYLAFTIPHLSLQVPADSLAAYRGRWPETPLTTSCNITPTTTRRAAYAAMITRMDRDIGRLLSAAYGTGPGRRHARVFRQRQRRVC